jgi:fucose permease
MLVGLATTERLLSRIEPLRLLRAAGLACAAAYALWLVAPSLALSSGLLFLVGFFAAPLYPIAKAQAYRALPGQSGMVNAVAHVFAPLDLAMPVVLGVVADRAGLTTALALLGTQPLGLALIAWWQGRPDGATN